MIIYPNPTWLYLKRHRVTNKFYFGKTKHDPFKYLGSGTYWKRHIKRHGVEHVETVWAMPYWDLEEAKNVALEISRQANIVESPLFANLMFETAVGGVAQGTVFSEEHRRKIWLAGMRKRRYTHEELDAVLKERRRVRYLRMKHKKSVL